MLQVHAAFPALSVQAALGPHPPLFLRQGSARREMCEYICIVVTHVTWFCHALKQLKRLPIIPWKQLVIQRMCKVLDKHHLYQGFFH